jgi:phospholipid/cholesterol/gamma-HCH transport system substrate-binding protein
MNEQTMRFRLGIFVLGALLLLAVLITLFGGFPNLFRRYDRYIILFDDATGIAPGTPVRRSGVRIGEVEKVELDDATGKVRVGIKVDSRHTLRKDDQPVLTRGLIGGDTSIDFVRRPPAAGQPPETAALEPGAVLAGQPQPAAGDLAKEAARLMPPAQKTLAEVEKVFTRIDKMTPLLEETLREYRELAKATRETVPALRGASDEVRELAKASRATVPELRRTNDEVQLAARYWSKVGERLDVLLQTNEDKLVKSLDRLNEALKQVNAVFNVENQRNLAEALRNVNKGSVQMESVTRNTDELVKESRGTMRRVNDSVTRSNEVLANMQKATQPMADRSASILRNLDESSDKLNKILGDLRSLMRGPGQSDGTLQRLLGDPSLYIHLDEAACMLTRVLPRVDRTLQDLEVFADKIARHPESLGLGGVVRPGTGLKEAPTGTYHIPGH